MPIAPPVSFQAFGSTSQSNSAESQLCRLSLLLYGSVLPRPYRKQATQETLKTVYAVLIPFKAQYLLLRIINRAFQWTLGERLYQNLNHKLTARLLFFALLSYKSPVFDVIVFTPCIHRLVLLFLCKVSKVVRTQRTA